MILDSIPRRPLQTLGALLAWLLPTDVVAQEPAPRTLTLPQALDAALQASPEVRSAKETLDRPSTSRSTAKQSRRYWRRERASIWLCASPLELRADAASIAGVMFDTPTGQRVPLSQLATISVERGPNTLSRENVQRRLVVQASVAGRDLGSTVADIERAVEGQVQLPPGYHLQYGGQFESQEEATRTLSALSLLAVAAIFLILYAEFRSTRDSVLVMANLPLALIGGVAAVLLTGRVVSIASLVGFVTLFGIATRNGILLVAHYRQLIAEGAPFREAVVRGSLERLSPILMTALTAGLALIPLALGGGEPGNELQTPMAIVILGGLLSSTALNMVVLPALYWL